MILVGYTKSHFFTIFFDFWSYVYLFAKNYLPLIQQIADLLKKIGLVEILLL